MRATGALCVAICGFLLAGCATPSPEATEANDPLEPANRAVYSFDEKFDKYVVLYAAGFYLDYIPAPARRGLHNFVANLDLPVTFANDVLQAKVSRASEAFGRFALNSTWGLGGIFDVATPAGLPVHASDFGQTLSVYGVGEGPFLVLPIIGPDPPRDLFGDAVDIFICPSTYLPVDSPLLQRVFTSAGVRVLDPFVPHARNIFLRQELEKGSLDPYATMRSTYRQVRASEIGDGYPSTDVGSGK
jgi:phospholipid-binding lipoprotein MlaA